MSNWLHDLPLAWMAILVFAITYLITALIYWIVLALAFGERARSFKAVSPGILPPLGIIFGFFVAFIAAQVWNDNQQASATVDREASALRAVVILASNFPTEYEMRLRTLIRDYIEEAEAKEWPMMAHRTASLRIVPRALAEALKVTLTLESNNEGQKIAQREITSSLETALEARRQRILISRSQVNPIKWAALLLQAVCALVAIAMVHSDNRLGATITLAMFATGVAVSALLIVAYDRPFTGQLAVSPDPLLQVMPETPQPRSN
jgi:hypothetical protein